MVTSKMFKAVLFVLLSIVAYSCCDDTKIGSKYYKGYIINRAETSFPLGMIRFADIFEDDEELESPARSIIYHESDGGDFKFDLNDCVYFKIGYKGKYQVAIDVQVDSIFKKGPDTLSMANNDEFYGILSDVQLNLHNADIHREGPKHTRRRIIKTLGTTGFSYQGGSGNAYFIETEKEFTLEVANLYVRESDYLANPSGIFFFSDTDISVRNSGVDTGEFISDMSLTHDHTH